LVSTVRIILGAPWTWLGGHYRSKAVGRNGGVLSAGTATRIRCLAAGDTRIVAAFSSRKAVIVGAVVDANEKPADLEELRV
jgi:hypothetical protein